MRAKRWMMLFCMSNMCCFAGSLCAQEYIFDHLTTKDGLLSNNILSLWQDKKGFLWIGSENGLQRYDGYHFITPGAPALRKPVDQILCDKKGRIWLRMGKTVGIFDPVTFLFREVKIDEAINPPGQPVYELQLDEASRIYLLIKKVGCFYTNDNASILSGKNNPFPFSNRSGLLGITDDPAGKRVWVNSTKGLGYYDKRTGIFYGGANNPLHHPLLSSKLFNAGVDHFYIDRQRRYWITTRDDKTGTFAFYCFDEKKGVVNRDMSSFPDLPARGDFDIARFTEFDDTTLLVYGNNCMSMRENGRFVDFRDSINGPYSIQFDVINGVLEDKEHILWVASDNGLYNTMATMRKNLHMMLRQDKGKSNINCLLQDKQGNIWIGTWGRGIIMKDSMLSPGVNMMPYRQAQSGRNQKPVWSMCQSSLTSKIWIGCQQGMLQVYDPAKKKITILQPGSFDSSTIRQITEDKQGNLWFGLQNGLLACYPKEDMQKERTQFQLIHCFEGYINKLTADGKGNLWVAVAGKGLYRIDVASKQIIQSYTAGNDKHPLPGSDIRDILPLHDSILLLAGDELEILHTRTGWIELVSQYNRIPIGKVYTLQQGDGSDCWLSTANGMYKYNYESGSLIKYTQWDGLITVSNKSFILESSIRLRNGKLAFAGNQHFVLFDPARYKSNSKPVDAQVTGFQVFNNNLPVDSLLLLDKIELDHTKNSFTIEFASLSFTQLEKLTYEYKLEEADKEWTSIKLPMPVRYTLVAPGSYNFLVRVKNDQGLYSPHTTRLSIRILPPFYKTVPFYALIACMVAFLQYYLHRMRLQRLLQVEKVRSKLARDLHDDIGSTLSSINILSNMALQQNKLDDDTSKKYMGKINESTAQMMESMDDIIWSINPLNDSIGKVLARMKQVAGSLLESHGIEYNFEAEDAVKQMGFNMEWRREIFLIYKEAINNIVKYARCTKVDVTLKKLDYFFELSIRDNGIGLDSAAKAAAHPTRGNGFINMKKRAAIMKGSLRIKSEKGKGTQVILNVPFA